MGKRYCLCCSNYKGKDVEGRKVTLHRVPADKKLRNVWWSRLKLIRKDLDSLKDHSRVCSEHFVNKKGPQPGDDVPSIFPNITLKASSAGRDYSLGFSISQRPRAAPPVLKKVCYLAQTEAAVMEDGTKSDRIIEQLIVVTETSKRKTSKRKKEKKTVQQRALYSLLGNTGHSLSLLGCWHQPGPSVSATDRRQLPGPQVVSQVERESDVAEETAESHCKPLLMSEVKRESDVTEGTPESWMVKEIAEVPGVHCLGEEAMSCIQVEWRTDARGQVAAKQPVLPGAASCDGADCTDPALMMSEVKVEIDVAEDMSASWEMEELVSAPKSCWVSRDGVVPWVEMPEEQSDPQAVSSSSMDVKVEQQTEPQRCSPSHRDHERRQAGGCAVSGVDTGAVGARDSCRGGPVGMWLTGKPGFKYSYENVDSEMFMKAEASSPVCSAPWHIKHEPMEVRDASVFNVQCVKSEPVQVRDAAVFDVKCVKSDPVEECDASVFNVKCVKSEPVEVRDAAVFDVKCVKSEPVEECDASVFNVKCVKSEPVEECDASVFNVKCVKSEPVEVRDAAVFDVKCVKSEPVEECDASVFNVKCVKSEPVEECDASVFNVKCVKSEPVEVRDASVFNAQCVVSEPAESTSASP